MNWGDIDENDDGKSLPSGDAIRLLSKPDSKGVYTETSYYQNADGKKVKVTRKFKQKKVKKRVNVNALERRKWEKFGDCKGLPAGSEQNVTYESFETITLDMRPKKRDEQVDDDPMNKLDQSSSIVVCRVCGETGHWTLKCPKRKTFKPIGQDAEDDSSKDGPSTNSKGAYIPLHLRKNASSKYGISQERDMGSTIRVTNLSEDTSEHDLANLFRRFGRTQRIFLAKDRQTGLSRGFAFVTFVSRRDAEKAIAALHGHGFDNLILHVEWAKPREDSKETTGDKTRKIIAAQKRRF
jgi:translation initiation factor 3 subunit G